MSGCPEELLASLWPSHTPCRACICDTSNHAALLADGPGLVGSLLAGISFAKALSYALSVPIIGINHLNAHLYANFINKKTKNHPKFPFIGLVISGGHTNIFLCRSLNDFKILGNTQDDAIGEAFDKVAKILKLGYPGGPIIEKRAR